MTAIAKDERVSELREMFRFLQQFRMLHENDGIDEFMSSYGNTWSLWDLEYLYAQTARLNMAQRRAITLCLVHGLLEREAALAMGVGINNPVGMYASLGLRRLLDMIDRGEMDRYHRSRHPAVLATAYQRQINNLAAFVKNRIEIVEGHWLFPCRPGQPPAIIVRSVRSSNGFLSLDPRTVLYEAEHGSPPHDSRVIHDDAEHGPHEGCIKPTHSTAVLTEDALARLRRVRARALVRRSTPA